MEASLLQGDMCDRQSGQMDLSLVCVKHFITRKSEQSPLPRTQRFLHSCQEWKCVDLFLGCLGFEASHTTKEEVS